MQDASPEEQATVVSRRREMPELRYTSNSVAWWLHDVIVHPLTGHLGLLGRSLRSPRLMALSHHLHNATAPTNDAWGDWAAAAYRAACNEESRGPSKQQRRTEGSILSRLESNSREAIAFTHEEREMLIEWLRKPDENGAIAIMLECCHYWESTDGGTEECIRCFRLRLPPDTKQEPRK